MIPLAVEVPGVGRRAVRNAGSPNRISFERHSSFTDRTQRSACGFRLGLRGGSALA